MADLEKQGISAAPSSGQYGSIDAKKLHNGATEKLPLFLGQWDVSPEKLYRIGLTCYVAWFVIHRAADIAYILTVDARFPEGLGHLYPSEAQRLESVAYTREVLLCGMIHRILVFCVVLALIIFQGFARFDKALREFFAAVSTWWETSRLRRSLSYCFSPLWRCFGNVSSPCLSRPNAWWGELKDRAVNGRLATDFCNRFGFPLSFRELLLGSVYLTLLGVFFFALSSPFIYWMQTIDLKFGFANSLSVSTANFKRNVIASCFSMLIFNVPQKFVFLAVLQYRLGWVFMWVGLFVSIIYAQYNVAMIAPMLGMNMKFPTTNFAVGRGFPLVETSNKKAPWISLNRIYFPDKYSQALLQGDPSTFYTNDKSKGQLALAHRPDGHWSISGTAWFDPTAAVYAETAGAGSKAADSLREQSWSIGGDTTRMGVRSGKELRDKLFGFASERRIGIGNIFMVDGSHKDARANAFVTGAGNHSIIGLYDTLFLGQRGSDAEEEPEEDKVGELAESKSLIQHATEVVTDVDLEEEDQDKRPPRNSAPTEAMNDDEIVAILAHELAHSALKHMEQGMTAQVATSFVTFATLGWMAHSPLAAAALSLSAPVLHVGNCAYDHFVGPPLEGVIKLFTDGLTRHNEYEADAYAALISERYGTGLQTALAKLSVNSNQDPDPPYFYEALHADHPPFARRWAHIEKVKKKAYGDDKSKDEK